MLNDIPKKLSEKISRHYFQIDACHEEIVAIRRCTLKKACQGHCGRYMWGILSRIVQQFNLIPSILRIVSCKNFSFFFRLIGNWVSPLSATAHDKRRIKGGSKRARRRRILTTDLTKLGHAVKSICQLSRLVSIRYSRSIPSVNTSCKLKFIVI